MVASLGYYGSVGRHLRISTNQNQPVGPVGATNLPGAPVSHACGEQSRFVPGLPSPPTLREINSIGNSSYNAMWAVLTKNMSHGSQFSMNYMWSKSMDINSLGSQGGTRPCRTATIPRGNYGLSDFDVRHHFAGTAIYALPFKGNRLVSGYQVTTIVQYQTGNPVNILASSSSFNGITGVVRPNLVGTIVKSETAAGANRQRHLHPESRRTGLWRHGLRRDELHLGLQLIRSWERKPVPPRQPQPTVYTGIGNIQRNAGVGPGFADIDLSGEKETKIFEGLSFTLRADAFDILNHPNFGQPSGNVQSATFGQITATRFATSDGGSSRQLQISAKFIF